jgi:hypothetical protein
MFERICPELPDGWYPTGTPEGDVIGFTNDLFYGHFTRKENILIMHYIYSIEPRQGNVQRLLKNLIAHGWDVWIVYPCEEMRHICEKLGFSGAEEVIDDYYRGKKVMCWKKR